MLKKKADIVNKLQEETGQDWKMLNDLVSFYWKEGIRKDIKELRHAELHLPELGSFKFVASKIEKFKETLQKYERTELLEKAEKLHTIIKERYELRNTKREIRKNMEKQMEDTGGNLV
jgi:hypothetical protein